jgi:hypothetical protein
LWFNFFFAQFFLSISTCAEPSLYPFWVRNSTFDPAQTKLMNVTII